MATRKQLEEQRDLLNDLDAIDNLPPIRRMNIIFTYPKSETYDKFYYISNRDYVNSNNNRHFEKRRDILSNAIEKALYEYRQYIINELRITDDLEFDK